VTWTICSDATGTQYVLPGLSQLDNPSAQVHRGPNDSARLKSLGQSRSAQVHRGPNDSARLKSLGQSRSAQM
jgi:hypothetical protein